MVTSNPSSASRRAIALPLFSVNLCFWNHTGKLNVHAPGWSSDYHGSLAIVPRNGGALTTASHCRLCRLLPNGSGSFEICLEPTNRLKATYIFRVWGSNRQLFQRICEAHIGSVIPRASCYTKLAFHHVRRGYPSWWSYFGPRCYKDWGVCSLL